LFERVSFKKVKIESNNNQYSHHYFSEVIENEFVVIDKIDTKEVDANRPNNRSNHVIEPKSILTHPTRSGNKRDKGTSKIMKFPEYYIPKSIFF
jgi:hypothetical protein